ncbi:MAG: FG-GAP-like repeat-containing protein [Candidatus Zhuqueibacterota bacterium]
MKKCVCVFQLCLCAVLCFLDAGFSQVNFQKHFVDTAFDHAAGVYSCDVDGDGRKDILGAAGGDGIAWWRNRGGQPISWDKHVIDENFSGAFSVYGFDVDADGDLDILGAAWNDADIAVWLNQGGDPISWQKQIIDGSFMNAHEVYACDFDGDGDGDVFGAAAASNDIAWWRNDGGSPILWTKQTIDPQFSGARSVHVADFDGDGDNDVAGAALVSNEVAWWRNDGGAPVSWTKFIVSATFTGSHRVFGCDMDLDGDTDILGAAYAVAEVAWWRNDGGDPVHWTKEVIGNQFGGSLTAYPADFDLDGDLDVVGAANTSDAVAWWRNDDQTWTRFNIDANFNGAWVVWADDLDGDRDIDVLCAGDAGSQIAWWESDLIGAHFSADVTSGFAPLTVKFSESSVCMPAPAAWAWDFNNDGQIDSQERQPSWNFEQPGEYTVALEVSNGSTSYRRVETNFISVFEGGSALLFSPENSNVHCPAAPELSLTEAATFEAWIFPTGWGSVPNLGFGRIVDKGTISLLLNGVGGSLNTHSLAVTLTTEGSSAGFLNSPENSISLDTWQHVTVTYHAASSAVTLYINGVEQPLKLVASAPAGRLKDNAGVDLRIGRSVAGMFFDGVIDEVRVWNTVRTQQEIVEHSGRLLRGAETGLVGYWSMDEAFGDTLGDGSGNGNDCSVDRAAWKQGVRLDLPLSIRESTDPDAGRPEQIYMLQNYPNPFNPTTQIRVHTAAPLPVTIRIFDVTGRLVKTLADGATLNQGMHEINWNGNDDAGRPVSSGLYFCQIESRGQRITKKMILTK